MLNKEKIARLAMMRAKETEQRLKTAKRRVTVTVGVCLSSLGIFLLTLFSAGILPLTSEPNPDYFNINDQQVPLAAFPSQSKEKDLSNKDLTLIKEGSTEQFPVVMIGEPGEHEFYQIVMTDDGYTLKAVPDAEYRLMRGSIQIGIVTITEGKSELTLIK